MVSLYCILIIYTYMPNIYNAHRSSSRSMVEYVQFQDYARENTAYLLVALLSYGLTLYALQVLFAAV